VIVQVYLVGGAVRDELLGLPVHERDFVVVGSDAETLLEQGYQAVGKDFPVFLHPQTKEEYALARIERKQGNGYTGFSCYAAPDVTLEQDLLRRDLTINAIAQDDHGQLHDPYGGITDVQNRILRHISPAFSEDPLRVLRVARFAARFHHLGFTIAPETLELMRSLSLSGELDFLTPERVWKECEKVLKGPDPQHFFDVLRQCDALPVLFPEVHHLYGVPARPDWHPEIDTGVHVMMALKEASLRSPEPIIRFATLCHDFGKALTPADILPSHHGHGERGLPLIRDFCQRFRIPNEYRDLALLVSELHSLIHTALQLRSATLLKLFDRLDVWRKPERLQQLIVCCQADFHGRLGFAEREYLPPVYVQEAYDSAVHIPVKAIVAAGFTGLAIREQLTRQRLIAIRAVQNRWRDI
jgi:tRNA nucleotidyltransferase (CCA-adding enzyme)